MTIKSSILVSFEATTKNLDILELAKSMFYNFIIAYIWFSQKSQYTVI